VWALSEQPRAVNFLRTKLPPAELPSKARMAKLIADLDSDRFEVRDEAQRALAEMGELAISALEEASRKPSSLEQGKRVKRLLEPLKGRLTPSQVRALRAVQALELAGSADARKVLQQWTRGAPAAHLTREAQQAVKRLNAHKP
jgi:HEAT repeat protein